MLTNECCIIGDHLNADILGFKKFGLTYLINYESKNEIKFEEIIPDGSLRVFIRI